MPTEEVFTTPHKDRADGTVTATKPLSHQGTMIEGSGCASKRDALWRRMLRAARKFCKSSSTRTMVRGGWVRWLVPHSSPIASSGMLFFNTLFEMKMLHRTSRWSVYSSCLRDGDKLTPEKLAGRARTTALFTWTG